MTPQLHMRYSNQAQFTRMAVSCCRPALTYRHQALRPAVIRHAALRTHAARPVGERRCQPRTSSRRPACNRRLKSLPDLPSSATHAVDRPRLVDHNPIISCRTLAVGAPPFPCRDPRRRAASSGTITGCPGSATQYHRIARGFVAQFGRGRGVLAYGGTIYITPSCLRDLHVPGNTSQATSAAPGLGACHTLFLPFSLATSLLQFRCSVVFTSTKPPIFSVASPILPFSPPPPTIPGFSPLYPSTPRAALPSPVSCG